MIAITVVLLAIYIKGAFPGAHRLNGRCRASGAAAEEPMSIPMSIAQLAAFLAAIKAEEDRKSRQQQEQARLPAPDLQYDRTTTDRRSPR